ncbi:MAG: winged helix-turn-helix domain-containing protein [Gammaproteobacteria bacterium]
MLWCRDAPVTLTSKVFETLQYLVEHADRVVTKREFLEALWPGRVVEESNLSQNIFLLRRMFAEYGGDEHTILTVPGQGYRFTAEVAEPLSRSDSVTPSNDVFPLVGTSGNSAVTESRALLGHTGRLHRRRWVWSAAALCAVLALGFAVGGMWWLRSGESQTSAARSAVVLADFKNATGDPAFDAVLDQALEIDLDQSPVLSLLNRQQVREELQYMKRAEDSPLDPDLAQQVCQREQARAVISGVIAKLGGSYVLALGAVDCDTGQRLAAAKAEVSREEDVLPAIDALCKQLRRQLGESIASIRRYSVPIAQVTTASMGALKAYSEAQQLRSKDDSADAIPLYLQALSLDPNFAMAYAALGHSFMSLNEMEKGRPFLQRAYELRDRVSAHDRVRLTAFYYQSVQMDDEQAIAAYQEWTRLYSYEWVPWNNMSLAYQDIGQFPAAIAAAKEALRLSSSHAFPYLNLAGSYLDNSQMAEAKTVCQQAVAKALDGWDIHYTLYNIAFVEGDQAGMAQQLLWGKGKPTESLTVETAARAAAAKGRINEARRLFDQAITQALQHPDTQKNTAERFRADQIEVLALVGEYQQAKVLLLQVRGIEQLDHAPIVFAEAGEDEKALALAHAQVKHYPNGTIANFVRLPYAEASAALHRGDANKAIALLQPALPYAWRNFNVPTLLATAYLKAGYAQQAADEYHQILAHPGVDISVDYDLAYLGLARADTRLGDTQAARSAYQQFFAAWQHANPEQPLMLQSRQEYRRLVSATTVRRKQR